MNNLSEYSVIDDSLSMEMAEEAKREEIEEREKKEQVIEIFGPIYCGRFKRRPRRHLLPTFSLY